MVTVHQYKAPNENVVVRGEGRRVGKIVRTSRWPVSGVRHCPHDLNAWNRLTPRKIPLTPLMTIQKIMNGYRPTPHQSFNRSNKHRTKLLLFISGNGTSLEPQGRQLTTEHKKMIKHLLSRFFTQGVFNNYHKCHTNLDHLNVY